MQEPAGWQTRTEVPFLADPNGGKKREKTKRATEGILIRIKRLGRNRVLTARNHELKGRDKRARKKKRAQWY